MKILVAPDSFKGSITAQEFCEISRKTLGKDHEVRCLPMADGGEGTCACLALATGGEMIKQTVTGPMLRPVEAEFAILGDERTAVIEMAAACGLPLVPPEERDIFAATTRGVGELMLAAADRGCDKIIMGIGGSATNDGGCGMASALGAYLLDKEGRQIPDGAAGLEKLCKIDLSRIDRRVKDMEIIVACDVSATLYGKEGAAYVFAMQKGARQEDLQRLDNGLHRLGDVIYRDLGVDVAAIPGSGAAGGLGAGLMAFLGAKLCPGFDIVSRAVGFEKIVSEGWELVITGEGQLSSQSLMGKLPVEVAKIAKRYGIPTAAVVGSVADDAVEAEKLFDRVVSLQKEGLTLDYCMKHAGKLLEAALKRLEI